jgi:hypothetical protein
MVASIPTNTSASGLVTWYKRFRPCGSACRPCGCYLQTYPSSSSCYGPYFNVNNSRIGLDGSGYLYVNGDVTLLGPSVPGCPYGGRYFPIVATTLKVDASNGTSQWMKGMWSNGIRNYYNVNANDMLVDSAGNTYNWGYLFYNQYAEIVIWKFNSSGVLQWQRWIRQANGNVNQVVQNYTRPKVSMAFDNQITQGGLRLMIQIQSSETTYLTMPVDGSKTAQGGSALYPHNTSYGSIIMEVTATSAFDSSYLVQTSLGVTTVSSSGVTNSWGGPYSFTKPAMTLTNTDPTIGLKTW